MGATIEAVLEAAMELSDDERMELADRLLLSISPEKQAEIDRAWADEVERREQAVARGEMELLDGDDVLRALEKGERP